MIQNLSSAVERWWLCNRRNQSVYGNQAFPALMILRSPLEVVLRDALKLLEVHIVLKVCDFNRSGDGVRIQTVDKFLVGLALTAGQTIQSFDECFIEAFLFQILKRPVGVLD